METFIFNEQTRVVCSRSRTQFRRTLSRTLSRTWCQLATKINKNMIDEEPFLTRTKISRCTRFRILAGDAQDVSNGEAFLKGR